MARIEGRFYDKHKMVVQKSYSSTWEQWVTEVTMTEVTMGDRGTGEWWGWECHDLGDTLWNTYHRNTLRFVV